MTKINEKELKPNQFFDYTPKKCLEIIESDKEFYIWNGEVIKVSYLERFEISGSSSSGEVKKMFKFITNSSEFSVKTWDTNTAEVYDTQKGAVYYVVKKYKEQAESQSRRDKLKMSQLKLIYDMYTDIYPELYV